MERILGIIFAVVFSFSAQAAQPSAVPAIGLGANISNGNPVTYIPLQNPSGAAGTFATFGLIAGDAGGNLASGDYYPFYKSGVQYQVTSGKTAYCFAHSGMVGTANNNWQLMSATASFAFGAASITGGVWMGGAAGKYPIIATVGSQFQSLPIGVYTFGSLTYPGIQAGGAQTYIHMMTCYEN